MSTYTAEQLAIIRRIKAEANRRYADPHERMVKLKANLATGRVETAFHNLKGGDADSAGYRQERASLYRDPTNVDHAIKRFFDEADQLWDGKMDSAELAARVQRPAAQYAHRYGLHDVQSEAQRLAQGSAGKGGSTARPATSRTSVSATGPKVTPGTTKVDEEGALVDALLQHKGGSLMKRYFANVDSGAYTTETDPTVTAGKVTTKTTRTPASSGASAAAGGAKENHVGTASFEGRKVAAWIAPILQYARSQGWKGQVNSGFRSFEEQTRIYNSGVRPAAKPGQSNHEGSDWPRGAVDVSDAAQLSAILRKSKFAKKLVWAGSKDPVHFSHPHGGSY